MTEPKLALVLTTIHEGEILDAYCAKADEECIRDRLRIIAIPDRKSPQTLFERARYLARRGFDVVCPALGEQDAYLQRLGAIANLVPYDSDNRRNVGFLMALEWGCDALISIDDDNWCREGEPFYQAHAIVCEGEAELAAAGAADGWFNVCDLLEVEPPLRVFPRGFPYHERRDRPPAALGRARGPVRLNAGLWLGEPDLDAMTWLAAPVRATTFRGPSAALGGWSPINTQNTALHRDAIAAFYFVRMGYPLGGMPIDRYGDIFSGYFCQACARHLGHLVRVGTPVALHRRNAHEHLRDAAAELACILVLEDLTRWLPEARLEGGTYADAYLSLAGALEDEVERFRGPIWTDATRGYFHQMAYCMRRWVDACRTTGA